MSSIPEQPEYNISPEGVLWRRAEVMGAVAVSYESLRSNPHSIALFMRAGRWPLFIEDGITIATAAPYRKDILETLEGIGQTHIESMYEHEIKELSSQELSLRMGRRAIVISIGEPPQPHIILSPLTDIHRQKQAEVFDEYLNMIHEDSLRGEYLEDPENGLLIGNRVQFTPEGIKERFDKDMEKARERLAQRKAGKGDETGTVSQ